MPEDAGRDQLSFRVVFDSVGYVRALISPSGPWGELVLDHYAKYTLLMSDPLQLEIEGVFERPEIAKKAAPQEFFALREITRIIKEAETVELTKIPQVSRDPNDDMVIATAVIGMADFLVTEDLDLLVLEQVDDVRIVTGLDFLRLIRGR